MADRDNNRNENGNSNYSNKGKNSYLVALPCDLEGHSWQKNEQRPP